jgi:hypothetical protein
MKFDEKMKVIEKSVRKQLLFRYENEIGYLLSDGDIELSLMNNFGLTEYEASKMLEKVKKSIAET